MAQLKQIQCVQVSFTGTSGSIPVTLGGVKQVVVHTSADCYIDFDQPVAPTQSYKLLAANTADTPIAMLDGVIQKMYAQGVAGAGTLYIIAIEG